MRSWLMLRLACALVLGWTLLALLPSCGARGFLDDGLGGAGGAGSSTTGGSCNAVGQSCAADAPCCGDLVCKGAVCKPAQICLPEGKACELTSDCCALDCLDGFCGGQQCKPPGEACGSSG